MKLVLSTLRRPIADVTFCLAIVRWMTPCTTIIRDWRRELIGFRYALLCAFSLMTEAAHEILKCHVESGTQFQQSLS
jgi:hypothetical protein